MWCDAFSPFGTHAESGWGGAVMAHSPGAREGQFVERQEPHHVGASDRVPTQEVRLAVAVEVCDGPQLPVHIRQRRQDGRAPPPSRSRTTRHSRPSPDCATPGPIGRGRSCRTGTARHAARSAHGDPSRLMSLAGASSCRVAWRPSSALEPQARPTRHTVRMTSRKGVAAGLGAKHSGRAKHRDRAMCDAYRSWRGGRMVDGRANTAGYAGSRLSTNSQKTSTVDHLGGPGTTGDVGFVISRSVVRVHSPAPKH
jgi:hypothetical protein